MRRTFQQIEAELAPKDLDLALGFLYQWGIASTSFKRKRNGAQLHAEVPKGFPFARFSRALRDYENSSSGRKLFQKLRLRKIRDLSWIEKYKQFLRHFALLSPKNGTGPALWVDPRGNEIRSPKADTIYIEAGLAFGTGTHTTTQLASEELALALQDRPGASVLDLGCGTAILAMVAKKLGAGNTVAIDNDPEALRVARENLDRNRVRGVRLQSDLGSLRAKFPVIVSNIGLKVLLELRPKILQLLAPGGTLILTGLLYRDCDELIRAYRRLRPQKRINRRGWAAVVFNSQHLIGGLSSSRECS